MESILFFVPGISLFQISPALYQSKISPFSQKYFKPLFHLIRFSIELIEFDHVKFPASLSSENGD